jgi:hypothetical protein
MKGPTLLIRASIQGSAITGNPVSTGSGTRIAYRQRLQHAIRNAPFANPVPLHDAIAVRILVTRPPGSAGDVDNIAKPILDALEPVLGTKAGRVRDGRVHHLEVVICETRHAPPCVTLELHRIGDKHSRS